MSWYIFPEKGISIDRANKFRQASERQSWWNSPRRVSLLHLIVWVVERSRVCVLLLYVRLKVSCKALYEELDSWEVIWRSPLLTRLLGFHFPFPPCVDRDPIQKKYIFWQSKIPCIVHQQDWEYKKVAFFRWNKFTQWILYFGSDRYLLSILYFLL